jgi:RNA polymerase sigma-70 factor (ECF subfamily)
MSSAETPDVQKLLAHASWVRALAHGLVADSASAEDVVQDTWVAALECGPREEHSVRGWLRRVVANFVFQHRRSEIARSARERRAATPEALPSVAEIAARAELERRLVGEVLALVEPYRSTVLYCFFENRAAVDVARELGVPSSTVRNRLKRALELLRARLRAVDREAWQGCFAVALPAVTSAGAATGTAPSVSGALVMGVKVKLGLMVAGAAAITGAVLMWRGLDVATREATGTNDPSQRASVARESSSLAEDPARAATVTGADGGARRTETTKVLAAEILVHGSITNSHGERVKQGRVEVADEWGARRGADVTDAGTYSISGLGRGAWVLRTHCLGYCDARRDLDLPGDRESVQVDFQLETALAIGVRFVTTEGRRAKWPFGQEPPWILGMDGAFAAIATREPPASLTPVGELKFEGDFTRAGPPTPGVHVQVPAGCVGVVELRTPPPAFVSAVLNGVVIATQPVDANTREVTFVIEKEELLARMGTLSFQLVKEDGAPIEQAGIALLSTSASSLANPIQSPLPQGVCNRQGLPPGVFQLQIRVPGYEHQNRLVAIDSGRATDLGRIVLRDGAVLGVELVDEEGRPAPVPVEWVRASEREHPCYMPPTVASSEPGSFFEAELPRDGILLRVADPEWAVNPTRFDTSAPRAEGATFTARRGTVVSIRARAPKAACELRLVDATGLEVWRAQIIEAAAFQVRLLPGGYTLVRRTRGLDQRLRDIAVETGALVIEVDW